MKRHIQKPIKLPKIHPTAQAIAALSLFALAVLLSRGNDMNAWEVDVFRTAYGWPEFLRPFFFVATQAGSIHMLGILLIIFILRRQYHVLLRLLLTATLAYQMSGFAKDIWGRARPNEILENVFNLDYIVRGPGFPSGHMALATAMALTIGIYLPRRYQWITAVWIISVGLSRMYLGIHAPLDIVGGFAIGWLCYALFRHVRLQDIKFGKRRAPRAQ